MGAGQPSHADHDAGVETPQRTCIATRVQRPPEELIRFVAAPDGTITPDLGRTLPGRGTWVTCEKSAVAAAVKSKAFARSLRRQIRVPDDLLELVERLLVRRALAALSLANKAGLVTTGYAKVEAAAGRGKVVALVHASDASADGVRKLDRLFSAVCRDQDRPAEIVRSLTNEQLSLAIGRPNVVHAGLERGGATSTFLIEAQRLARFRSDGAGAAGSSPKAAGPTSS
jgi:hypothetical protein